MYYFFYQTKTALQIEIL